MHSLLIAAYFFVANAHAQVFNGPGLEAGVAEAGLIDGPAQAPLRFIILDLLFKALEFLGLAGMVMFVIAGFMFVLSGGSDTAKDRAKKIMLYVIIGLIVILFAGAVVGFFLNGLSSFS